MHKVIKNPEGTKSFRRPGLGFGFCGPQELFTGQEVKEAIASFIIDFFFNKKDGEMIISGEDGIPETVTEDKACDLVGEFFKSFDFASARKLASAGFYPCGSNNNLYSNGQYYARKFANGWSLRAHGCPSSFFATLEGLLEWME